MGRPVLDGPSDYLLAGVIAVVVTAMAGTWLVGQTAALLTGHGWPHVGVTDGLGILTRLPRHPHDPAAALPAAAQGHLPGAPGFIAATALDVAVAVGAGIGIASRVGRRRRRRGFASLNEVAAAFSSTAVTATAARLRPSTLPGDTAQRTVRRQGLRMGGRIDVEVAVSVDAGRTDPTVHRGSVPLRIGIENSVLVLAAPRQGKTSQVVIPWVTAWDGPAVVTSVRADVVRATAALRPGRTLVMDLTDTRWVNTLTWSPTAGCASFDVARRRADLMVTVGKASGPGSSDSTNAAFFGTSATNLLAGWLHAAALTHRDLRQVLTWALDDTDDTPVKALRDHPRAAAGTAGMLDALYRSPVETRSNLFATVLTALAPLLAETARDVFCPTGSEAREGFDLETFLDSRDTIHLIVPETHATELAPLISSFVDDIVRAATARAARTESGRLDPPLGLFLDEVANVAPLPQLPQLMSYGAGNGLFLCPVLQDLAQARARWGHDGADMLWSAATCKVVLGGLTGDEPEAISRLAGTYRETLTTTTRATTTGLSTSNALQDRPILTPEAIRTLDPALRQALVLHATTPPVITRMVRHYEGPRAADHAASVAATRPVNRAHGEAA